MGAAVATTHIGRPHPLGVTPTQNGTNFAIYAREQTDVTLLIRTSSTHSISEYKLGRTNRSGHVWHVEIRPAQTGAYTWRVGQKDDRWCTNECLDPWATTIDSATGVSQFNKRENDYNPWAVIPTPTSFDWQDVSKPALAWSQLVIYELHVRGFTKRAAEIPAASAKGVGGSYAGIVERIPYLKALGINAVELLPIMEFNETEWSHISPATARPLSQYWGYSTVSFFAPMNRFSRDGAQPLDVVNEFKFMVRELHRAGIEIILDVVYNHTAEMGLDFVGRGFYGMKQLAPFSYYLLRDNGHTFVNHSGCGNTINCNSPSTQDFICESLRYWAHEMQVDGFRFDLASVLCRGTDGQPLDDPPLIQRITKDPCMRDVKLIAEPWDCGGLYQVGSFPHHGVWAEWNGKFRDCVRRFIKGDAGMIGEFATRMCGSQDLYGKGRRPFHSINFVTAHDGFSLRDLVSYNGKHNDANGENNNDGEAHNNSWNCGTEGETTDDGISKLRLRQMKNFFVALLVAAGTPMLNMGDEYGHTKHGNNNGWCQDSELSWFDWREAQSEKDRLLRFTQALVHFRRSNKALQHDNFLSDREVTWHGLNAHQPDWHTQYNFMALSFRGEREVFVAFNAGGEGKDVELPRVDGDWGRAVDTNLEAPKDVGRGSDIRRLKGGSRYGMAPYSALVLRQMRGSGDDAVTEGLEDAFSTMQVSGLDSA